MSPLIGTGIGEQIAAFGDVDPNTIKLLHEREKMGADIGHQRALEDYYKSLMGQASARMMVELEKLKQPWAAAPGSGIMFPGEEKPRHIIPTERIPPSPHGKPSEPYWEFDPTSKQWAPKQPAIDVSSEALRIFNDPKIPLPSKRAQIYALGFDPDKMMGSGSEKNLTEEQLVHGSLMEKLNREPTKTEILDEITRRKKETAEFGIEAKTSRTDIPALAKAMAEGQMSRDDIANTFGVPVRAIVEKEVLRLYPKFNFVLNEANAKWPINPGNMRTVSMLQAALPRILRLADQVSDLKNQNVPAINEVMRQVSIQTGHPAFPAFESNRNAIVQEINTALSGSATGSDFRVKIELENLHAARAPQQIVAAIINLREAMLSRLEASFMPIYPLDVVQGKRTREEYFNELATKYRGKYSTERDVGPSEVERPDKAVVRGGKTYYYYKSDDTWESTPR